MPLVGVGTFMLHSQHLPSSLQTSIQIAKEQGFKVFYKERLVDVG